MGQIRMTPEQLQAHAKNMVIVLHRSITFFLNYLHCKCNFVQSGKVEHSIALMINSYSCSQKSRSSHSLCLISSSSLRKQLRQYKSKTKHYHKTSDSDKHPSGCCLTVALHDRVGCMTHALCGPITVQKS